MANVFSTEEEINLRERVCELSIENEELKYELLVVKEEKMKLEKTLEEKEQHQTKLTKLINDMTELVNELYEKICDLKRRLYTKQLSTDAAAWIDST